MHAIEVTLERIDAQRPEAAEWSEPGVDLHERFRPNPVKPPLCIDTGLDKTSISQDPQVFGHGRLR